MPYKPLGPCSFAGCPNRAVSGGRCQAHTTLPTARGTGQRPPREFGRRPDTRPSAAARGYDADWRKIRDAHLKLEPNCRVCGQPGKHVDHIKPLRQGGTHDESNLRTLCASCHSRKTAQEDGGYGNQRRH